MRPERGHGEKFSPRRLCEDVLLKACVMGDVGVAWHSTSPNPAPTDTMIALSPSFAASLGVHTSFPPASSSSSVHTPAESPQE